MASGFDLEVHGGGLAGTTLAILMARSGCRVLQHIDDRPRRSGPREIICPASRTLFRALSLPDPDDAIACAGILSCWGGDDPDYHDYRFMTGTLGLAAGRERVHMALARTAIAAGVTRRRREARGPASPGIGSRPYQVMACGRSAARLSDSQDRLVALFVCCNRAGADDRLIVQSAEDGWWYLAPGDEARLLAFVTRPSLIPSSVAERAAWLARNLAVSGPIARAAGPVTFDNVRGIDARVGRAAATDWPGGCALGDATLALDPLSGIGISRALEGARALAAELLTHGAAAAAYRDWIDQTHAHETAMRGWLYGLAASQFPLSRFWSDRRNARAEARDVFASA